MALSDEEKEAVEQAIEITLQEGLVLLRQGLHLEEISLRVKPVLRAVLDGYGTFSQADVDRMVDSFKMTSETRGAMEI
jgi:hypothetical protein